MDWRDFLRGIFGNRAPPAGETKRGDHWPPPPPISDFQCEDDHQHDNNNSQFCDEGFVWGRRNRGQYGLRDDEGRFEEFGNRFVFGDLFSAMGEMFQEMERSMRDMESFIGNIDIDGHPKMIPFPSPPSPSSPPPAIEGSSQAKSNEENIRDFVLKEPDSTKKRDYHNNSKHYIPAPDNVNEKVDRDLDDLYQNSKLDFSDLPVPSSAKDSAVQPLSPYLPKSFSPFGNHGGVASSYQKTYQTFSFRNGRWEGEIVKEDQNGKEVTRYYQDKDGQRHETTEYFPKDGSSVLHAPALMDPTTDSTLHLPPSTTQEGSGLFQFFNKFFKPRM